MDFEGILAITLIFGTPVLLALVGGFVWSMNSWRKQGERERARATFERLTRDKLDVIRTALAMGRSDDEVLELDQRLERLIGTEQMLGLLDPKAPKTPRVNAQIMDADLVVEVERQQQDTGTKQ